MRTKKTSEQKWHLFDDVDECARKATEHFQVKRWRWKGIGIPDRLQIGTELQRLARIAKVEGFESAESGRLIYVEGKYGYQR